jgi:hypothetical protein
MRSRLPSESVGAKRSPCWGPLDYCRWRAAYRRKRLARPRISRRGISSRATNSRSVRKKSLTSAWRRSMCSTRRLRSPPAFSSLEAAAADAVMAVAAAEAEDAAVGDAAAAEAEDAAALEAASGAAAAAAVVAEAVACPGAPAPCARLHSRAVPDELNQKSRPAANSRAAPSWRHPTSRRIAKACTHKPVWSKVASNVRPWPIRRYSARWSKLGVWKRAGFKLSTLRFGLQDRLPPLASTEPGYSNL